MVCNPLRRVTTSATGATVLVIGHETVLMTATEEDSADQDDAATRLPGGAGDEGRVSALIS